MLKKLKLGSDLNSEDNIKKNRKVQKNPHTNQKNLKIMERVKQKLSGEFEPSSLPLSHRCLMGARRARQSPTSLEEISVIRGKVWIF